MSYRIIEWARRQSTPDYTCRYVLLELAYFANHDTRLCCPSLTTLCDATQIKKKDTIRAATDRLIASGLLSKRHERGDQGQIVRTLYFFREDAYSYEVGRESPKTDQVSPKKVQVSPEMAQGVSPETGRGVPSDGGRVSPETGRNKKEEQVTEQVTLTSSEPPQSTPPKKKPKAPSGKRGTRLTIEELPDEWKAFCEKEDSELDPQRVFDNFKDYWQAQPGAKAIKADWYKTWRNCVRSYRNAGDWKRNPMLRASSADKQRKENLGKKINGQTQLLTVQERKDANDWGLW